MYVYRSLIEYTIVWATGGEKRRHESNIGRDSTSMRTQGYWLPGPASLVNPGTKWKNFDLILPLSPPTWH